MNVALFVATLIVLRTRAFHNNVLPFAAGLVVSAVVGFIYMLSQKRRMHAIIAGNQAAGGETTAT